MKNKIEYTLDSREVAEMVEKQHKNLMRDIKRYLSDFNELNIEPVDFFIEDMYEDEKGEKRPCYKVTKKGCEFIAHKLAGIKGTAFTARYINRFHEMENMLNKKEQQIELPWFIRKFKGKYIVLERDFISITGLPEKMLSVLRGECLNAGLDFNGYGWIEDKEEFRKKYGFEYGDDKCMNYLNISGVIKILNVLKNYNQQHFDESAYNIIINGINALRKTLGSNKNEKATKRIVSDNGRVRRIEETIENSDRKIRPIQINIMLGDEFLSEIAPVQQKE